MRRILPYVLALAALAAIQPLSSVHARQVATPVTFQLHVTGAHDPHMTFWVAYGPLDGRFGLIRLRSAGSDHYVASRVLPPGRTVFSYIAGTGTAQTRLGPAPGAPAVTIARVGPATALRASRGIMLWRGPLG